MKEQELRERLNSLTGPEIPAETHYAFLSAVSQGKEGKIMKKKISAGLVFALVLILVTVAAIAASVAYDLKWWYEERTAEPDQEMVQKVMEHRVENPEQQQDENDLINVTVQESSWVPEKDQLTTIIRVSVKDPEHYELFSMYSLDVDGCYFSPEETIPESDLEEAHTEHWLWRESPDPEDPVGHGPVREMMDDSSKRLLLIDYDIWASGTQSLDECRTPEGDVLYWVESHPGYLYVENDKKITEEGIPCTLHYRLVEYTEGMDDKELYTGGTQGEVTFIVRPGN